MINTIDVAKYFMRKSGKNATLMEILKKRVKYTLVNE